ncbi:MAG TPA: hypothetical protein VGA56_05125, partial [Opitutaceae bacterium]
AFKDSGAWPLASLRQSFLNGSLTRLLDPDRILRTKIVEFVERGDFGLLSSAKDGAGHDRLWHAEPVGAEEVDFKPGVFLLTKAKALELKAPTTQPPLGPEPGPGPEPGAVPVPGPGPEPGETPGPEPGAGDQMTTLRLVGTVPPELWNRLGTKLLPKLRSGKDLTAGVDFSVRVGAAYAKNMESELHQILADLGLGDRVKIERS